MELAEVPCLQVGKGQVLIQTKASLISAGTEKMLVEFSKHHDFDNLADDYLDTIVQFGMRAGRS